MSDNLATDFAHREWAATPHGSSSAEDPRCGDAAERGRSDGRLEKRDEQLQHHYVSSLRQLSGEFSDTTGSSRHIRVQKFEDLVGPHGARLAAESAVSVLVRLAEGRKDLHSMRFVRSLGLGS